MESEGLRRPSVASKAFFGAVASFFTAGFSLGSKGRPSMARLSTIGLTVPAGTAEGEGILRESRSPWVGGAGGNAERIARSTRLWEGARGRKMSAPSALSGRRGRHAGTRSPSARRLESRAEGPLQRGAERPSVPALPSVAPFRPPERAGARAFPQPGGRPVVESLAIDGRPLEPSEMTNPRSRLRRECGQPRAPAHTRRGNDRAAVSPQGGPIQKSRRWPRVAPEGAPLGPAGARSERRPDASPHPSSITGSAWGPFMGKPVEKHPHPRRPNRACARPRSTIDCVGKLARDARCNTK